jgi:hypothetical protein
LEVRYGYNKYPELFIRLETDPYIPLNLGAEVYMHMGPEIEKRIITSSVYINILTDFVYGPWRILKVTEPFMVITIKSCTLKKDKARLSCQKTGRGANVSSSWEQIFRSTNKSSLKVGTSPEDYIVQNMGVARFY